jgi:hypothetical protein
MRARARDQQLALSERTSKWSVPVWRLAGRAPLRRGETRPVEPIHQGGQRSGRLRPPRRGLLAEAPVVGKFDGLDVDTERAT